jgi:hypothetical protein
VAYAVAKWRENTLGAVREARLRSEAELARREASVEAAELHAQAEAEKRAAAEGDGRRRSRGRGFRRTGPREHPAARPPLRELQRLAKISPEEARALLLDHLREEYGEEAQHLRRSLPDQVEQDIDDEARRTSSRRCSA